MKSLKYFPVYIFIFSFFICIESTSLFAQDSMMMETEKESGTMMMEEVDNEKLASDFIGVRVVKSSDSKDGFPYTFMVNVPALASSWRLSVAEYNSRTIFTDSGSSWPAGGYKWTLPSDEEIFSGIYYTVSISFENKSKRTIKTETTKFYIPLYMIDNQVPTIFFEGDTVDVSNYLYKNGSSDQIFEYIVKIAKEQYPDRRILLRGHASFLTTSKTDREKEQVDLLELSKERSTAVLDKLVDLGVDSTRIYYESLGGSEELSNDVEQRWKNRRVEVFFVKETKVSEKKSAPASVKKIEEPKEKVVIVPEAASDVQPWPDIPVMGQGLMQAEHMLSFVLYHTPTQDPKYIAYIRRIILYYIQEANREGVNYDVAFAQMLLETNYLRFTGQVRREQYNFAGIGAVNAENSGNWFATELIGVRAHIQHLKGYATSQPLNGDVVDPRHAILEQTGFLGSAPLVSMLSGRWATDPNYSQKILVLLRRMYNYSNAIMEAQVGLMPQ